MLYSQRLSPVECRQRQMNRCLVSWLSAALTARDHTAVLRNPLTDYDSGWSRSIARRVGYVSRAYTLEYMLCLVRRCSMQAGRFELGRAFCRNPGMCRSDYIDHLNYNSFWDILRTSIQYIMACTSTKTSTRQNVA